MCRLTTNFALIFCTLCSVATAQLYISSPRGWPTSEEAIPAGPVPQEPLPGVAEMCTSPPPAALCRPWALIGAAAAAAFITGLAVGAQIHRLFRRVVLPSPAEPTTLSHSAPQAGTAAALLQEDAGVSSAAAEPEVNPPEDGGAAYVESEDASASSVVDDGAPAAAQPDSEGSELAGPCSPHALSSSAATGSVSPPPFLSPTTLSRLAPEAVALSTPSRQHAQELEALQEVEEAGQLVTTLMASLHIDPQQLTTAERLQLLQPVLQAMHTQHARRHGHVVEQLSFEANLLRGEHVDITAAHTTHKRVRDAHTLAAEHTRQFRAMCSDTLLSGVAVMVLVGWRQVVRRRTLVVLGLHCRSLPRRSRGSWGLWAAAQAAESVFCHASALGSALFGLAVLFAAPWALYRTGLLSDYHTMPVAKLVAGLGVVCGTAGYAAVGRIGGDPGTWLGLWIVWTALHIAASAAAHRICRRATLAAQQGGGPGAVYEAQLGWLPAAMWVGLGLVLPCLTATLPFSW